MHNGNFETFFDCGFSKIRAGTFNTNNNDFKNKNLIDLRINKHLVVK